MASSQHALVGKGGEEDGRDLVTSPQQAGSFRALHRATQLDVHEHEVGRKQQGALEGGLTRRHGADHLIAKLVEPALQVERDKPLVFDDQDARRLPFLRFFAGRGVRSQVDQFLCNSREQEGVVDRHGVECGLRHGRAESLGRVLHDGNATVATNLPQAGYAVIQGAGEHHTNYAPAVALCGGAEQHIDRWARAGIGLRRASFETHETAVHQQMHSAGSDGDSTGHDAPTVDGSLAGQKRAVRQNPWQAIFFLFVVTEQPAGRAVEHDKDRGGESARQSAQKELQSGHPSR